MRKRNRWTIDGKKFGGLIPSVVGQTNDLSLPTECVASCYAQNLRTECTHMKLKWIRQSEPETEPVVYKSGDRIASFSAGQEPWTWDIHRPSTTVPNSMVADVIDAFVDAGLEQHENGGFDNSTKEVMVTH